MPTTIFPADLIAAGTLAASAASTPPAALVEELDDPESDDAFVELEVGDEAVLDEELPESRVLDPQADTASATVVRPTIDRAEERRNTRKPPYDDRQERPGYAVAMARA
ncbi:MAG: hypothetical protein U0Q21_16740 [Dermatophilaceae bacterium]